MGMAVCPNAANGVNGKTWEALLRFGDRRAQFFVGENRVGWDTRTLDDRRPADLSGNAFNQIAFRPVYGHDRLHGCFHGSAISNPSLLEGEGATGVTRHSIFL